MRPFRGLCDYCRSPAVSVVTYDSARITHGVFICDSKPCRDWLNLTLKNFNAQHPPFYLKAKPPKIFEQRYAGEGMADQPEPIITQIEIA